MNPRKSSRAIIINNKNEIFLFLYRFDFFKEETTIWITPGGSLEESESFEDALKRELFEELGIQLNQSCRQIYYRNPIYTLKNGQKVQSEERFYLVCLQEKEFSFENWTESEKRRMTDGKWWSIEEIRQSKDEFFSPDIIRILSDISNGKIPNEPQKIL